MAGSPLANQSEVAHQNEPLRPFALRYMERGASSSVKGGKTATSRQTIEDGEEEADTDWDDT